MEWATTATSSDPPGQSASLPSFNHYPSSSNQSTTYHTQVNIRPLIARRAPASTPNSRNLTGHTLLPPIQQTTTNPRSEPPGNVYSSAPSHFYGHYTGYEYPPDSPGLFYSGGSGTLRPMDTGPSGFGGVPNPSTATVFGMSGPSNMHPTGAAEMGLSTESGMDIGWLSFMRDCGIMDTTEGG